MNYSPGAGVPVIAAIGSDGVTVLESYDLSSASPISTPGLLDGGAFRGISRGQNDIFFFRISGSFIAEHDVTLYAATVPEPSTLLLAAGAIGLAVLRRRFA